MILGTKARYAVMAMVDLVKYSNGKPVTLSDVAIRQEISLAYLEQIFPKLKRANLVQPVRGPGGGYLLANPANETWILDIVEAVDESLKMTRCNKEHLGGCMSNKAQCVTHSLWAGLGHQIEDYLGNISLEDVCERRVGKPRTAKVVEFESLMAVN
jgi:Rrf2 family iron-sulfur cluster assembly transcriptional regulator